MTARDTPSQRKAAVYLVWAKACFESKDDVGFFIWYPQEHVQSRTYEDVAEYCNHGIENVPITSCTAHEKAVFLCFWAAMTENP